MINIKSSGQQTTREKGQSNIPLLQWLLHFTSPQLNSVLNRSKRNDSNHISNTGTSRQTIYSALLTSWIGKPQRKKKYGLDCLHREGSKTILYLIGKKEKYSCEDLRRIPLTIGAMSAKIN